MPTYLLEEVDELTKDYNVNRSTYITEAIKAFNKQQKEDQFYEGLGEAMQEVKLMIDGKIPKISAQSLLDEI
ncbi:hypothetical protein MNB_SUP05-SYMBIONT-5-536 [hydrothermal vent metagenome]|uniref:Ribbon-helix-helix protein CopG domain-containing protein n=1 Tax=hydrothermal vent metagenome TaxID=652676 RepID=A0A1W1E1C5_9ZZZZ